MVQNEILTFYFASYLMENIQHSGTSITLCGVFTQADLKMGVKKGSLCFIRFAHDNHGSLSRKKVLS
jgi:hypothetical protein